MLFAPPVFIEPFSALFKSSAKEGFPIDFYYTIKENAVAEIVEKKSRFISEIRKTLSEAEAQEFVAEKKKEFWNAAHNVYAYVIQEDGIKRYSDDGEPTGTSGIPTLDVLTGRNLVDCTVVTTRYFGGTLLGTGGLVRAYSKAASLAADRAGTVKMELCSHMMIECDYSLYGKFQGLIPERGGVVTDTKFTDLVQVFFYIPSRGVSALQEQINEVSAGGIAAKKLREDFEPARDF